MKPETLELYAKYASVSGDAWVSLKASFTKGWFIGGDDSGKITDITDKTGSTYWKNQYVLGDYEITPIEDEKKDIETIEIGGIKYSKKEVKKKKPKVCVELKDGTMVCFGGTMEAMGDFIDLIGSGDLKIIKVTKK